MRVIAGTARGRRLIAPKGLHTRPTPDRVREALFSILMPDLPEARVLDLFAGTGALGIEALSRGARCAVFVEKDPSTAALIERNLQVVPGCDARVIAGSVEAALRSLAAGAFDLVFVDPPYDAGRLAPTLAALAAGALVREGGVVLCEHRKGTAVEAEDPPWQHLETRAWGDTAVTILRHEPRAARHDDEAPRGPDHGLGDGAGPHPERRGGQGAHP